MQHESSFDPRKYLVARERLLRRAALWHAARLACESESQWRAAWPAIGRAVAAQLELEGLG
ncbi:hypothetical protein SAMN05421666_1030 [Roseovarius nanhaiticus]|uniref:Uncharacterized protein n=1 Tax=Roseovarius nanhaiticus TaxID=573024 RepID=A0A1N7FGT7_9RHOB|nr:hypothetical protein SAMN05216208_1106 [Roseovarius nanhaiticus]SIR99532.1 hypothetical protein SAMN05421666_1030 [Roseovarius nanhaiticus]